MRSLIRREIQPLKRYLYLFLSHQRKTTSFPHLWRQFSSPMLILVRIIFLSFGRTLFSAVLKVVLPFLFLRPLPSLFSSCNLLFPKVILRVFQFFEVKIRFPFFPIPRDSCHSSHKVNRYIDFSNFLLPFCWICFPILRILQSICSGCNRIWYHRILSIDLFHLLPQHQCWEWTIWGIYGRVGLSSFDGHRE